MKRTVVEANTVNENGFTVTAIAYSHDQDLGPASVSNRACLELDVRMPSGESHVIRLSGAEAAKLLPPVAAAAVLVETEADIARRYLRDFRDTHLNERQVAELERIAAKDPLPDAG